MSWKYKRRNNINKKNTETQRVSQFNDFSLHIRSSSFLVSVYTLQSLTNLLVFLSLSYSFLLPTGWWLLYSHIWFLSNVDQSKSSYALSEMSIFYDLHKPWTFGVPNRILRNNGTEFLNTKHKKGGGWGAAPVNPGTKGTSASEDDTGTSIFRLEFIMLWWSCITQ